MFLSHISSPSECLKKLLRQNKFFFLLLLLSASYITVCHYLKLSQWEITHQFNIRCEMAMASQFIVIKGCPMK